MIRYFTETTFNLKGKRKLSNWIKSILLGEEKKLSEINFIFCNDEYLLEINKKHLNHDYYTDVISFDNSSNNIISGEIYISIDRIKQNATSNNVDFSNELHRIMIHGVLHFIGYKDKTQSEKIKMTAKEDYCLSLLDK
jgi:probable rRNA maturation factor